MKESELNKEIFSRYGAVTRARGVFLYTKKGVRLTDCFQAGGRAILGWGGGSAFTRFKNVLNRGLTGSFTTEYTSQIDRAVSDLLGGSYKVYFFRDKQSALKAGLEISPENTSIWMPWRNEQGQGAQNPDAAIITPPLPWTDDIYLLAVSRAEIKGNCQLPSPLIAAITRSIYDLIAAIQTRGEKDFFLYDTVLSKYFERKGPYLYPKISETKYDDFVKFCLENEIVISPDYNTPSIVPFGADKGVFTKLKNAEFIHGAD